MIRFHAFGGVDLRLPDGTAIHSIASQPKRLALLSYLAFARPPGFQRRDTLLALLWPEQDDRHAHAALSKAVHHLRQSLGEGAVIGRGAEELATAADLPTLWRMGRRGITLMPRRQAPKLSSTQPVTPLPAGSLSRLTCRQDAAREAIPTRTMHNIIHIDALYATAIAVMRARIRARFGHRTESGMRRMLRRLDGTELAGAQITAICRTWAA